VPRHSETTLAAIKSAVRIVSLASDYGLRVTRHGSKYKALCPFHDDHNPSMELNPDRESYKCWVCNAGGDIFDFVKEFERVDFNEAVRILADRAGIALEPASGVASSAPRGPSKSELFAVNAWAETAFAEALGQSEDALQYVESRGIDVASVRKFRLGYAPGERGWLVSRARRANFSVELLERAGLVSRPADAPTGTVRERFRGRLIFPIHDARGRAIGFGGRVLPQVERLFVQQGKNVAKYLNSPETPLFQKRKTLYAGDLARKAAHDARWVAVVEGYTDVIVAHQVNLCNVVGTLGTALGDDHVTALRRLTDKVVLVFDGDDAGQKAADRSLELFLGHEVDVRVLTLPSNLDPADFLLKEGADAFRELVDRAVDPLAFALKRAGERFDLGSIEGARQASEWVLEILARVPAANRMGLDVKVDRALDTLAGRLRVSVETLRRRLRQLQREARTRSFAPRPAPVEPMADSAVAGPVSTEPLGAPATVPMRSAPIRTSSLDATDRELVQIVLTEPSSISRIITRVSPRFLRDAPLRTILQACFDLHGENEPAVFERVALRLEDPAIRALAAGLLLPLDSGPMPDVPTSGPSRSVRPAPWEERLEGVLARLDKRNREDRLNELQAELAATDQAIDPDVYNALRTEYLRIANQRPGTNKKSAS
jgi:DNA primase